MSKPSEETTQIIKSRGGITAEERFDRVEQSIDKLVSKLDTIIEKMDHATMEAMKQVNELSKQTALLDERLGKLEKIVYAGAGLILTGFIMAVLGLVIKANEVMK